MRLFIAEKPELAKAIATFIDPNAKKSDGYYTCYSGDVITYCFGHMLQLKDPHEYDSKFEKWNLQDLPFQHIPWQKKISADKVKQVKIIKSLMDKARIIVNAGDPDDEGQLLIDELIDFFDNKKPVQRVLISGYTPDIVEKGLNNIKSNDEFYPLGKAAEARSVADQLYGYNLTRLFTLKAREVGYYDGVISIGRVQTPILGLVVRRDKQHKEHIKTPYYPIKALFKFGDIEFEAKYNIEEKDNADNGKILDKQYAETIIVNLENKKAEILAAKTSIKKTTKILPYNLLELQKDSNKLFKYKPEEIDSITQRLREIHHLITYNRSDCQFLFEEQHQEAPEILEAIKNNAKETFAAHIDKTDTNIKSRAFNSKKVSAHHAIIPTTGKKDLSLLDEKERNVYLLIARAYIAQFLEDETYQETKLNISVENKIFSASQKKIIVNGWKVLFTHLNQLEKDNENNVDLTNLNQFQIGICLKGIVNENFTSPLPLYNIQTLLDDFKRVAKYVKNPKLRELLLEKDKDKEGEHGGIGTPATRGTILANLISRGLLIEKGNNIISSQVAQDLYAMLPDIVKYPDLTALWFEQQQLISVNKLNEVQFVKGVMKYVTELVNNVKKSTIKLNITVYKCQDCGHILKKIKGKKGLFWLCINEKCNKTYNDLNGKPVTNNSASRKKISKNKSENKFII